MLIVFTGHRDRLADPADIHAIEAQYPRAAWMHGGAVGFDTQVHQVALSLKKKALQPIDSDELARSTRLLLLNIIYTVRPTYGRYPPRQAPIIRNIAMVDKMVDGDLLFACYDGRAKGGTAQCVRYAREKGKQVVILKVAA
jgi:predicted Rossmann fold nucleotide-binding protein DprA/Smf involved in DNA uptake